jgi:hypothetical protein
MSLINNVSAILSNKSDLDDIVYDKSYKGYSDDIALLDLDIKKIIPAPPKNSSEITTKELKTISQATSSRSAKEIDFILTVDKDPLDLFYKFLDTKKLSFPIHRFNEMYNILEQYIYALKNYFNRARPEQLAPYHNIDINVMYTETHHAPAYPSGHTMYAALAANMLSDLYPEHKKYFFELTKYCGLARILQGVHYPSDNKAAIQATAVIYQAIKRRFEDGTGTKEDTLDRSSR